MLKHCSCNALRLCLRLTKNKIKTNRRRNRAGLCTLWKSQMPPKSLRPIETHQLCAIARSVLRSDPTIDDCEWKERTKLLLSKQGYEYPSPQLMASALAGVERAMRKSVGPRPVRLPQQPERKPLQQHDPPWRGRKPAGWAVVARMLAGK